MKKFFIQVKDSFVEKHYGDFVLYCALILGVSAALIVLGVLLVKLLFQYFDWIILIGGMYVTLYFIWRKWREGKVPPPPPKPPIPGQLIARARARGAEIYPAMLKCAMLILCDVCHYTGNALIKPFSLSSFESPGHFDITSEYIIVYQFIIAKGEGDISAATLRMLADRCISQRISSHSCPGLPTDPYLAQDGSHYDPVKCFGVYDCSSFWRVDFVLTNEAVVAHLLNEQYDKMGPNGNAAPMDERNML